MSLVTCKTKPNIAENVVRQIKDLLSGLGPEDRNTKRVDDVGKQLSHINTVLQNDDNETTREVLSAVVTQMERSDVTSLLVTRLGLLDWEARKAIVSIWTVLMSYETGGVAPAPAFVEQHPQLIDDLINGYESKDTALSCGAMLREALKHKSLALCLLVSPQFPNLFKYSDLPSFDLASDAFMTLKDVLRRHKSAVCAHLGVHYTEFFQLYEMLLQSPNYVTRRQALKLLGDIILDRCNVTIMMQYIGDAHNLRLIMTLLRDPSKTIQFEAFHVFKVFVANPNKPEAISKILGRNKDKLLSFLDHFHMEKEDEQFEEEKELLAKEIAGLKVYK